ncbi:MAG: pyruvate dehydrogenase (acetyl-transferring) E1 component subunit alpha [Pseudomonadales bacterium]|nr:pyruvate dehydrogenase (acetyl-transferring) E1 component subunit alpha [Pseudomonadales bacterium]
MKIAADFTIPYYQYLSDEGKPLDSFPEQLCNTDLWVRFYKHMVLVRTFDQKVVALQRTGQMGTYPSSLGQEAIGSAVGFSMASDDVFVPYYRDQATQLLRGVPMEDIMRYWGGDERGSVFTGDAKEDFPTCVPIATQITHAAGIATAFKVRRQRRAVVTTCGDGATSRGDFSESLNLAGTWQLPMVVVVNNNQWAISVRREEQTAAETIAQKAISAGIEGIQVDGNDPIALLHVLNHALEKAHNAKGPTLIEAISYRLCDHTTADDATRYRSAEELSKGWEREPIKRLQNFLYGKKLWDEDQEKQLIASCKEQVQSAVEVYTSIESEPAEAMFDYLYADLPQALEEQRADVIHKASNMRRGA